MRFRLWIPGVLMFSSIVIYGQHTRASQRGNTAATLTRPNSGLSLSEFKGKVQSVQVSSNTLTVVDPAKQTLTVRVSSQTRVTDVGNQVLPWSSLTPGDPVFLYFDAKQQLAIQIDRQATTAESVLGIDHPVKQ